MAFPFDDLAKRHVARFTDETVSAFERGEISREALCRKLQDAMAAAAMGLPLFWLLILNGQSPEDMEELLAHVGIPQDDHAELSARRVKKRRAGFQTIEGGKSENEEAPAGEPTGAE